MNPILGRVLFTASLFVVILSLIALQFLIPHLLQSGDPLAYVKLILVSIPLILGLIMLAFTVYEVRKQARGAVPWVGAPE